MSEPNAIPQTNSFSSGIELPRGGGAIRGLDEEFSANQAMGALSLTIPLPVAQARGFTPSLSVTYSSTEGNGSFGLGWSLNTPTISRRTNRGLPRYLDGEDSDVFQGPNGEELIRFLEDRGGQWEPKTRSRNLEGIAYRVDFYRPRTDATFNRIERWTPLEGNRQTHWRVISTDNVTSVYGKSIAARLADPEAANRIFTWFLERSYDDKGNLVEYDYRPDSANDGTWVNTYLHRVRYGNATSFRPLRGEQDGYAGDFYFETIFDYGEFNPLTPWDGPTGTWNLRPDSRSSFRSGFEIRTLRRCRGVYLFHHIPDVNGQPGYDGLVSGLRFTYEDNEGVFSLLTEATATGYRREENGDYTSLDGPPFSLNYQAHAWNTTTGTFAEDAMADPAVTFLDLYGDGMNGILHRQNGLLYYRENQGEGRFSPPLALTEQPVGTFFQLTEIEGNGRKNATDLRSETPGYHTWLAKDHLDSFRYFPHAPRLNPTDDAIRFIDLTGDGRPDILLTENAAFSWHQSLGEDGYEAARKTLFPLDEAGHPEIVLHGPDTLVLADMSGDGLTDLVRIRNGSVAYWPNLGYGRFGRRRDMAGAPVFAAPDQFDAARIRLADLDGSGVADLFYLDENGVRVWLNRSGNGWQPAPVTIPMPVVDDLSTVRVLDLLGTGTACLIWTTSKEGVEPGGRVAYVDLMEGAKPYLLSGYRNNSGKEVSFSYRPSTHFFLEDARNGRPWKTKLPFPVHCLTSTVSRDLIRGTVFVSAYSYHHGCYDFDDREFRGFGCVEKHDTETFATFTRREGENVLGEEHHQPPVRSVSWYHTGSGEYSGEIHHLFGDEYFDNPELAEFELPDPRLPQDMTPTEYADALRALRGTLLRTEVYSDDDSEQAVFPYTVSYSTVDLLRLQPKGSNEFACFRPYGGETVTYHYDRRPADPRISHLLSLEHDAFGQVLTAASVVYPRRSRPTGDEAVPDVVWAQQNVAHVVLTKGENTNTVDEEDDFRWGVNYESRKYELLGHGLNVTTFATREDLLIDFNTAADLGFEEEGNGSLQRRLSGHRRSYFLGNDLSTELPLGTIDSLGMGWRTLVLAYTPTLVGSLFATRVRDQMMRDAGYEHSEGDQNWWIPSGTTVYPADAADHFFMPVSSRDPFGVMTSVDYDAHHLAIISTTDALGLSQTAEIDYRTLAPWRVTDVNGNRSAVRTDARGAVVASAVMGKVDGDGDTLDAPTTTLTYDPLNWMTNGRPNFVRHRQRETYGDPASEWQESFTYFDGGGGAIMHKTRAANGPALQWNEATQRLETVGDASSPRWIGNGRTVVNNKGLPILAYEPYFSTSAGFEDAAALVNIGRSPVNYYDSAGRLVRTDYPDGTLTRSEFDPWRTVAHDANDTVLESEWYARRGAPDPNGPEPTEAEERAAWLAARHAGTPVQGYADVLGRTFFTESDYGNGRKTSIRSETDLTGRYSRVFDQGDRRVGQKRSNLAGQVVNIDSAEKGTQYVFQDVIGKLVRLWDNDQREFSTVYDATHRPVAQQVAENGQLRTIAVSVYGDQLGLVEARTRNLAGVPFRVYESAGMLEIVQTDFVGRPTQLHRRLPDDFRGEPDWSTLLGLTDPVAIATAAEALLDDEVFTTDSEFDALSRPLFTTAADGSVLRPEYDESGMARALDVRIAGTPASQRMLVNQTFDARGLPQTVDHGNGVRRRFTYDEENYRLRGVDTYSLGDDPATEGLQALRYVYDGVGNVTTIRDESQATRFFRNAVVSADQHFAYDAIYQLVTATGRESAARVPAQPGRDDLPSFTGVPHDNDATAVRRYRQEFEYDDFGNLLQLRHVAQGGAGSYTRRYQYAYQNDATDRTNRLVATNRPNEQNGGLSASEYAYDGHGNLTRLPGMDSLNWNYADRLTHIDLGGGGEVFYQYASSGKRVRKTIVRQGGLRLETTYLGNVERYREYGGGGLRYERETLQVSGVARVDTKRVDTNGQDAANPIGQPLIRYQYGDHQGSANLEVDAGGNLISYEQFHPFGTSAYRTFRSGADASRKRYRFAGRERDQESGLDYGGARYYAPWLGRWISTDPAGIVDGFNLYRYCRNNPVNRKDLNGMNSDDDDETPATRGDIIERSFDPDDLTEEQREALNEGKVLWNGEIMSREEAERLMEEALAAGRNVTRSTPAVELGEDNGDGGEPIDVTVDAGPQATPGTGGTETAPAPEADGNTAGGGEAGNAEEDGTLGSAGAAGTVAGPGTERFIWEHRFRGDGIRGKTRGFILQNMYTNEPPWRLMDTDNVPNYDNVRGNRVQQIKSTDSTSASYRRRFGSRAIRSARRAITSGQVTRPGVVLEPEAVVITRTDAPAAVADDFAHGANRARGGWTRNVQRVRGLPGVYGHVGRGLSVAGFGLSAYSLYNDIQTGDWAMGIADTLGTVGGGIELYAIAGGTGTTIAGASAMTVGVATAGVGLAIGSGISGYRAFQRGDTAGVAAGAVGVASGIAITAGIIGGFAAAPVVLAAGIVGAIGVGIFHAGRYFDWW